MARERLTCKICDTTALEEIREFPTLPRVTSDCIPFREGGTLAICRACGGAQAVADERWFADIADIYRKYDIYHQSGGVEQHVIDPRSGVLRPRSTVLLERLAEVPGVPRSGTVLDVGCGRGGTLDAFAERESWMLYGLETDERNLPVLSTIRNFVKLYTCTTKEVPQQFDLVTMVHSLEHFPEPVEALESLRNKIAAGGRLFVQVPDAVTNPFEYLVADHMIHFTTDTLGLMVARAGLSVDCMATDWVTKELSLVARVDGTQGALPPRVAVAAQETVARVRLQIQWLHKLTATAQAAATEPGTFGLFGASIAATWLCNVLGDRVAFFVEEDKHRIGRTHMGRPILAPSETPSASVVFVPLIPAVAAKVQDRLSSVVNLRLPPLM